MPHSIQNRLFLFLLPFSMFAVLLAIAISFVNVYLAERKTYREQSIQYLHERGQRENLQFQNIVQEHSAAKDIYMSQYNMLTQEDVDRAFQMYFERHADGTMRSVDALFEGIDLPSMGYRRGFAAFLSGQHTFTPERKQSLFAAFLTIANIAPSIERRLESLWFFNEFDDLIIFAPNRDDNLMFYRKGAPADFGFQSANFALHSTFEENPNGITKCTALSRFFADPNGEELVTGCQTPMRANGVQFGVWGTTLPLTDALHKIVTEEPLQNTEIFVINDTGAIVAHKSLATKQSVTQQDVEQIEQRLQPVSITSRIAATEYTSLSTEPIKDISTDRFFSDVVITYELGLANWSIVAHTPRGKIVQVSIDSILPTLIALLMTVLICVGIIVFVVQHFGIRPIAAIVGAFSSSSAGASVSSIANPLYLSKIVEREDEIGLLARVLRDYRASTREQMGDLEYQISLRTRELQRANDAKSSFLATMSHELRTPLNGIMGVAGVLRRSALTSDQAEMVRLILKSAEILERQLSDALDISRVESGQFKLNAETLPLSDITSSIVSLYSIAASEKELKLLMNISKDCSSFYVGDAVRLKQVIGNLLSNAIKFTDEGEVEFSISVLGSDETFDSLMFKVRDTGCGLDMESAETIFAPFSQADTDVHRNYGGTGLGLTVCKALIELMGGRIEVDSEVGKGSEFRFYLDLERSSPARLEFQEMQREEELTSAAPIMAPHRILMVEDHPVNQRVVELILEPIGYDIVKAENGLEALNTYKTDKFDLILMDLQMPVMNGIEAITAIRSHEKEQDRPRCPIIVLSANALQANKDEAMSVGADRHVSKPILPEVLVSEIQSLLKEKDLHGFPENAAE